MKRQTQLCMALGTRCALFSIALAVQQASGTNQVAGVVASEPGTVLLKRFTVPQGAVLVGVEFVTNDERTVFPKVSILRGPASRLVEATPMAEVLNARCTSLHRVRVAFSPVTGEASENVYVAVAFPASDGVRRAGDGAGIGATQLSEPSSDSFVAPTPDEKFQSIDLDLAITLLYRTVGKAGAPDETRAIIQPFLASAPNPASSMAQVQFGLDRRTPVTLTIYDVAGRRVRLLVQGPMDAGVHVMGWDGRDERRQDVAAGVYIAKLQAGDKVLTLKMVLAK